MTLETLIARVNAMPPRVRIAAVAVVAALLFATIATGILTHAPRENLFANPLKPEELNEVQTELASWNVAFTPSADNVIVETTSRNSLLLRLSLAGVPHAHVATSSETLANIGVLTPQSVIDAQTRSGLAGDIEVGLRSIDGVDDARVIIAPAKSAEFADESAREASAGVRLRLHPGAALGREAIAGIRHFVSASVPGLDASHVTILDDRGVALADGMPGAGEGDSLQRSLQSALDDSLGAGTSIVRVHADFTAATTERREVVRDALRDVPIAQNDTVETYDSGTKRYEKRDLRDERGSDTREVVSQSGPGEVARLSTAVFVDASRSIDLEKVRQLASATVGFVPNRGDSLVVQAVDFHHDLQQKHDGWFLAYGAIVPLLPALATAIGLLLFARLAFPLIAPIVASLVERASIERRAHAVCGYAPAHVRSALAHEPPHAAAAIISALPAATAAAVLELYPPNEREAIVARMARVHSPLIPSAQEILGRHA